jgi:hypothetical protein
MKSVASPKFALILSLALAGLFATPQQASAGPTELKALAKQLNGGVQPLPATDLNVQIAFIQSKTGAQVAAAVIAIVKTKTTPAAATAAAKAYAGEALKRSDDPGFGTTLGQAFNAEAANPLFAGIYNASPDPVKKAAAKASFIGTAAKNAATSTGAFAEWIEGFARELTATNQEAYDAAKIAIASKTAAGRIIASREGSTDVDTDAERITLVQKALLAKSATASISGNGLSAAAQEIAMFVGESATNPATFAHDVIATSVTTGTKTTQPLLAKLQLIATGTVASNPDAAAAIVDSLFNNQGTGGLTGVTTDPFFAATVKVAAKLATSVALVADAEQVEAVGAVLGAHIGQVITNPTTNKKKVAGIAQTQVNAIAKGLVLGLTNRTILPTYGATTVATRLSEAQILTRGLLTQQQINDLKLVNSRTNRLDEIGEVGAYLLGSIKGLAVFQGKDINGVALTGAKLTAAGKQAAALVSGLLKTIITSSAKVSNTIAGVDQGTQKATLALVKAPIFQATAAEDAAGSIALTLRELEASMDPTVYGLVKAALTATGVGKKIAGSAKAFFKIDSNTDRTIATLVEDALKAVLNDAATGTTLRDKYAKYEDGTQNGANGSNNFAMGPYVDPIRGTLNEPETDIRIH